MANSHDKDPHFLYTHLILDLMKSLVNHWSPLSLSLTPLTA